MRLRRWEVIRTSTNPTILDSVERFFTAFGAISYCDYARAQARAVPSYGYQGYDEVTRYRHFKEARA